MTLTSKYYTPELSELHVGFACEYQEPDEVEWTQDTSLAVRDVAYLMAYPERVRVKHLDQEDIESLGFELIESTKSNYYGDLFSVKQDCKLGSLDFTTYRLLLGQQGRVQLTVIEDNSYGGDTKEMNFAIKNKSELKKILKQIGYE